MTFTFSASIASIGLLVTAWTSPSIAKAQEKVLRPGDQINLRIGETPPDDKTTIAGLFTVSKAGTLRLPRLKEELQAAGVAPSKLVAIIEKAYRDNHVFKKPKIWPRINMGVQMTEAMRFITVTGEVKGTGDVPYRPDLTLLAAISARGGFTDCADGKSIRLIRDGKTTVHNLKRVVTVPERGIKLRPGDRIIVPRREPIQGEADSDPPS